MSTYEELMVILTIAMLIVAILNYTQKSSRPARDKSKNGYNFVTN